MPVTCISTSDPGLNTVVKLQVTTGTCGRMDEISAGVYRLTGQFFLCSALLQDATPVLLGSMAELSKATVSWGTGTYPLSSA